MTQTTRALTEEQMRRAARVAAEEGVTITIESGGRVYKIAPGSQDTPLLSTEKDMAACDHAFGVSA